ncbi:peptidase [Paenibacillus spongiae]|uniref:Peptidase n=1 Tax=Paenibacillus spongiae TaxID=2909671 RepID=A0ABY5S9H6_9BACL|nr:peptidase [Paenibacillus spongiae]UVI29487.1 peptidase [Paenibacillus spongiae]
MKKMHKALATTAILAMTAVPIAASAQNVPTATIHNGQGAIVNQVKVVPGTMGQITNFVNDKSGKFITVTGRGLAPTDQSEIILAITKDTKIIDAKGKTVPLKKIIDEKKIVKAFYGPNITKSLPARGTALTLVVQDQSFTGIDGTVTEVRDTGIVVKGTNIYSAHEEEIVLHFADKAQILGTDGKAVEASAIKPGMSVKAFYGPAVTASLPPQSTTNYVIVDTESVKKEAPGTNGIITNVSDSIITVIGNPLEQGGVNYVFLTVDEDTQIVDEDGNALKPDALKADIRVDAYYGEVMTMIYPARTHADKIVVKAEATNKVEGTIADTDREAKDQIHVDVASDKSTDNDVILNISEDTQVITPDGLESELKPGTKILAYHSSIMTRSLPPITNAEIIIVAPDDNAAESK